MAVNVETPFTRALVAGAVAGTSVDLSLYPIDTLKTRLQSSKGFYAAGGFRGVYSGVGSAALGAAPGAALFFVTYEHTKAFLRHWNQGVNGNGYLQKWAEPLEHMGAASAGEIAACAVRVPTEVVKQRAQAIQYRSSYAAFQAILQKKSTVGYWGVLKELYRGWTVTIIREVPFTVIQFPLWEALKQWRRSDTGHEHISAFESGAFGSLAGAVAAGITTPLDVLKTRLMLSTEKHGMFQMLFQILRESGPRAFLAGMTPRITWIGFGGFVFLGSYQLAWNML